MDGYSILTLVVFILSAFVVIGVKKRKEYKYSLLDISGVILNLVIGIMVYPPLCLSGLLLSGSDAGLLAVMVRLMPPVCVAGVASSVILRRLERPGPSFLAQFAGLLFYGLLLLLAIAGGNLKV